MIERDGEEITSLYVYLYFDETFADEMENQLRYI